MEAVHKEWLDFLTAVFNGNVDLVARYVGMRPSKPFDALEQGQIACLVSVDTLSEFVQTGKNLAGLSESSGSHYTRGL